MEKINVTLPMDVNLARNLMLPMFQKMQEQIEETLKQLPKRREILYEALKEISEALEDREHSHSCLFNTIDKMLEEAINKELKELPKLQDNMERDLATATEWINALKKEFIKHNIEL